MINNNEFILGFILANQAKKRLEEKGADVPKNFGFKHALFSSVAPMPMVSSLLLNNEAQKLEPEIPKKAQEVIDKFATDTIKQIGKIGITQKQLDTFVGNLPKVNLKQHQTLIEQLKKDGEFNVTTQTDAVKRAEEVTDTFVKKTIEMVGTLGVTQEQFGEFKQSLPAKNRVDYQKYIAELQKDGKFNVK